MSTHAVAKTQVSQVLQLQQVVHTQPLFQMKWVNCWFTLGNETACGQGLVPRLESQTFRHLEKGQLCLIYGVQIVGGKISKAVWKIMKWQMAELPTNRRWELKNANFINPRTHQVRVYRQEFIIPSYFI